MFLLEHWGSCGVMGLCVAPRSSGALLRAGLPSLPGLGSVLAGCPCQFLLCPDHPVLALGSGTEMQHFELQLWVTLSTGAEGTRAAHWQG